MAISRRKFVARSGASLSALALLRVLPANAAEPLQEGLLPSADEMWSEVKFVNKTLTTRPRLRTQSRARFQRATGAIQATRARSSIRRIGSHLLPRKRQR